MRTKKEIKDELQRLEIEMDKYNDVKDGYMANKSAIRYWAIRWVMEWEKDIPGEEK